MKSAFPNAKIPSGTVPKNQLPEGAVEGLGCAEDGCDGTLEIRWDHNQAKWFYGCNVWPDCEGVLPAKADGSPRGRPRTRSLMRARRLAHEAFDPLWRDGHISRGGAYVWLREVMNMTEDQAHMFEMNEKQCEKVVRMVREKGPGTKYWDRFKNRKPHQRRRKKRRGKKPHKRDRRQY